MPLAGAARRAERARRRRPRRCSASCESMEFRALIKRVAERARRRVPALPVERPSARRRREAAASGRPTAAQREPRRRRRRPRPRLQPRQRPQRDDRSPQLRDRARRSRGSSAGSRAAATRGRVAIDTETDRARPDAAPSWSASRSRSRPGEACYIPLGHARRQAALDFGERLPSRPGRRSREALALLKPLLEDPSVLKIGHNVKYDLPRLRAATASRSRRSTTPC